MPPARSLLPDIPPAIEPLPQDHRFDSPAWQYWPFNLYYQSFLLMQQWLHNATTGVRGVSCHDEEVVTFVGRQFLDLYAPTNSPWTNPDVLRATCREGGTNLVRGLSNWFEDWQRAVLGEKPVGTENLEVGKSVAITPGKVIYRNRLIELIQYAPATPTVKAEPVLIVPAWIMKYYILDLSPENSLVKYLVERGHTVFMISWKNPRADDRDLGLDDYRTLGISEALAVIEAVVPDCKIHAVGYCLGGTLLAIAAAAMARDNDFRLQSVTLFAAETDFSEPGELGLFIDETQITFLEDLMWDQGFLDIRQMAGAFQLLRSNDLIWSEMVRDYLLGERQPMTDLMAWNADGTRLPYQMHSEYLRSLYLRNDLAEGRLRVVGRPVTLTDIRVPIFAVSTVKDHVAPWRSVYKLHLLTDTSLTFVLTTGGHNAGIVSEPGHPHRSFQMTTHNEGHHYVDPETWQATAVRHQGGILVAGLAILARGHSSGLVPAPPMGATHAGYPSTGQCTGRICARRVRRWEFLIDSPKFGCELADNGKDLPDRIQSGELGWPALTSLPGWAMVRAPVLMHRAGSAVVPSGARRPTMAMITDASPASQTEAQGVAFARGLADRGRGARAGARADRRIDRASGRFALSHAGKRDRHGHGQSRTGRPEAGGNLGLDRDPGFPPPSG